MKVLHVLPSIDPALGGVVESGRLITMAMSRAGVHTEVLSVQAPTDNMLTGWAVKVHSIGSTISYYGYSPTLVPWLTRNHRAYDAVVVHGVWRYASVGAWRALRGQDTPYFLFLHGMLDPWFARAYPLKHLKKTVFWHLIEHRVLRDARGVLYTCEAERIQARQSFHPFRCRERVVGLGTADAPAEPTAQRSEFLDQFPHLRGRRVILFLSRIHRVKGCDLLIRAFAATASADRRLHLVIAGADEEGKRPQLEGIAQACRIADRITWTGHLNGNAKWGAYRAAEVFALPSHTESYGHSIVEAMACNLPVLITDKVNICKEIGTDEAGIVNSDDLDGTVRSLQTWNTLSPERRKDLGANARRCFSSRFELEGFNRRFIDYLRLAVSPNLLRDTGDYV